MAERYRLRIIQHGTTTGYQYHKCRCDLCRKAQTDSVRQYRATQQGRAKVRNNNANAQRRLSLAAQWMREKRPDIWQQIVHQVDEDKEQTSATEPIKHGTLSMYTHGGCRCDLCREANADHMRQYRATRKVVENLTDEIERLREAFALACGLLSTYEDHSMFAPDQLMQQFLNEARRG